MLNDNPLTWSSNPWARNSPELNDPNLLKTPPPESKQAWRQRISRYAPDQAWRFVIEHTANPPRQRPSRVAMMAQDSTISTASADLNGLSARQILKRFIRERSCAQEFAERYLDVREKVAIYPGEEIDDDPLLSQVVMQQEVQLEIDDALIHLDSLLAILSYIQKTLPLHWWDVQDRPPLPRPSLPDICNLWEVEPLVDTKHGPTLTNRTNRTASCLFSSFALYTERLSAISIIITIFLAIGLFYLGIFLAPYISSCYRWYRIEALRTDVLKLWYAFRTDPESIDSSATHVLAESRFWVVEWYLLGDTELYQVQNISSIRQPGSTTFRWSFKVPWSWLGIEICVNRRTEKEGEQGERDDDMDMNYWQIVREVLVQGNDRLWARWAGVPWIS